MSHTSLKAILQAHFPCRRCTFPETSEQQSHVSLTFNSFLHSPLFGDSCSNDTALKIIEIKIKESKLKTNEFA